MPNHLWRALAVTALVAGALLVPTAASAAPPPNDDFANATTVDPSSLPVSDSITIDEATSEPGEPAPCLGTVAQTAWYKITPSADSVLRVRTNASFYYQFAAVFEQTGSGLGGLSAISCLVYPWDGSHNTFSVQAAKTYYVQVGSAYPSSGTLGLSLELVPPPANDDFADATVISRLPFSDSVDTSAGSVEPSEPIPSCSYTGQPAGTVWYRYTPPSDGWVSATTFGSYPTTVFAAYSGAALGSLIEIVCRVQYGRLTIPVLAGHTYSFLVGGLYGVRGTIGFQLDVAPNPVAAFGMSIGDPSIYDTIQFYDQSYDPAEVGIQSESWSFGDGATSSNPGCCPTHRYAKDGDYTVELDVTTADGRTASTRQLVHVKTHDVTISKVTVPQTASVGQTRSIAVGLTNTRYPETVQVQLLKSVAGGGWQQVGSLTQYVPVRGANRPTSFGFSYTFAPDDATLGKISFQAVATIQGARDAIPTDNGFISLPTTVH
jgi:PKD repeat protein